MVDLYPHQKEALTKMRNGCILCGGVGSGKSRTSLAYYERNHPKLDLYIITTARKRDSEEWQGELTPFKFPKSLNVVVDSWNNVHKYTDVKGAFFIFDEQRVVGKGEWVKSFLKITKTNYWILLSATPGDCWQDYVPVFIANGFYRNRTDFNEQHVVWARFCKFPKVDRYLNVAKLTKLRDFLLIDMTFERKTTPHHEDIIVDFNKIIYKDICRNRWNPYTNKPIETASEFCYILRKVVNSDESRQVAILELFEKHPRAIIFYNFDYELDILKSIAFGCQVAEWNGHKHQPVPEGNSWVYLVQYSAGCEAWNCITTDTIIFYSQNYSYKVLVQASGRIDRLNTPYSDLYYYHLRSRSGIDLAINAALKTKKTFNERSYCGKQFIRRT